MGNMLLWLAQGLLLNLINLSVSQMSEAREERSKGWKSPDCCAQKRRNLKEFWNPKSLQLMCLEQEAGRTSKTETELFC